MLSLLFIPLLFFVFGGLFIFGRWLLHGRGRPRLSDDNEPLRYGLYPALGSAVVIVFLVYVTQEEELLVEPDGSVRLIEGNVRFVLERDAFLARQAHLVDQRMEVLRNAKSGEQLVAENQRKDDDLFRSLQPTISEAKTKYYREHPEAIPSREQLLAESYRQQADRLDQVARNRKFAELHNRDLAEEMQQLIVTKHAIQGMRQKGSS